MDGPRKLMQDLDVGRLGDKSVGAEAVGTVYIGLFLRGGENDNDGLLQARILTNAFENLQARYVRQFEVEQYEARQRMRLTIGVLSSPFKVLQCLPAMTCHLQRIGDSGLLHRHFHETNVVFIVFDEQDGLRHWHREEPGSLSCWAAGVPPEKGRGEICGSILRILAFF